ncbi:UNKNOWN [Stylonychia lemnae]|uniref:Uncharacterized protein n=1 Tax=Stylonychia lemnae TaxID=5949 RepID=A0A078A595_STYLE|nr:UNKNOWN [Stylonychia lemnae]|eukprot:CDW77054.1 UNKNOWN [Stylonychia lemnae]
MELRRRIVHQLDQESLLDEVLTEDEQFNNEQTCFPGSDMEISDFENCNPNIKKQESDSEEEGAQIQRRKRTQQNQQSQTKQPKKIQAKQTEMRSWRQQEQVVKKENLIENPEIIDDRKYAGIMEILAIHQQKPIKTYQCLTFESKVAILTHTELKKYLSHMLDCFIKGKDQYEASFQKQNKNEKDQSSKHNSNSKVTEQNKRRKVDQQVANKINQQTKQEHTETEEEESWLNNGLRDDTTFYTQMVKQKLEKREKYEAYKRKLQEEQYEKEDFLQNDEDEFDNIGGKKRSQKRDYKTQSKQQQRNGNNIYYDSDGLERIITVTVKHGLDIKGDEIFLENVLIPRRIKKVFMIPKIEAQIHNCGLVCTVEWQNDNSGKALENSYVSYETMRLRHPQLLCEYFERITIFKMP